MKLAKAKEILQLNLKVATKKMPPDVKDALQLAIEAIIFKQQWCKGRYFPPSYLLPRETED